MHDVQLQKVLREVYAAAESLHGVRTDLKHTGTWKASLVVAALVVPETSSQEGHQKLLEDA